MDNLKKIIKRICPHCKKELSITETSYELPPEILAIFKQFGINIKDFNR